LTKIYYIAYAIDRKIIISYVLDKVHIECIRACNWQQINVREYQRGN